MLLLSLREARAKNLTRYFTGIECVNGHIDERIVSNRRCRTCLNETTKRTRNKTTAAATIKAWRLKNKDHVEEYGRKYIQDNSEAVKARRLAWLRLNPDYYIKHNKDYRAKNKEQIAINAKKWRKENKGRVRLHRADRRARLKLRTPSWLTKEDKSLTASIYEMASMLNDLTFGLIGYDVDHVIPIAGAKVSGLHVPSNMQIMRSRDNLLKSNRFAV